MNQTTGVYLNVYGRDVDVFVLFNEPNDAPTEEEIIKIGYVVESVIDTVCDRNEGLHIMREALLAHIYNLGLNCTNYGVQVIVQDL